MQTVLSSPVFSFNVLEIQGLSIIPLSHVTKRCGTSLAQWERLRHIKRGIHTHPLFPDPLVYLFAWASCSLSSFPFFSLFSLLFSIGGMCVESEQHFVEVTHSVVSPLAVEAGKIFSLVVGDTRGKKKIFMKKLGERKENTWYHSCALKNIQHTC